MIELIDLVIADYREEYGFGEKKLLSEDFFNWWGSSVGFNRSLFEYMLAYHIQEDIIDMTLEDSKAYLRQNGWIA